MYTWVYTQNLAYRPKLGHMARARAQAHAQAQAYTPRHAPFTRFSPMPSSGIQAFNLYFSMPQNRHNIATDLRKLYGFYDSNDF